MTTKNAALLALVGTGLLLLVLVAALLPDITGVANGTVPAVTLLVSLVRTFACLTVFVFFWAFRRS